MGGRATGRVTMQTRDVVVEGLTLAYLGMNLLGKWYVLSIGPVVCRWCSLSVVLLEDRVGM